MMRQWQHPLYRLEEVGYAPAVRDPDQLATIRIPAIMWASAPTILAACVAQVAGFRHGHGRRAGPFISTWSVMPDGGLISTFWLRETGGTVIHAEKVVRSADDLIFSPNHLIRWS